jgi:hypothetical protein
MGQGFLLMQDVACTRASELQGDFLLFPKETLMGWRGLENLYTSDDQARLRYLQDLHRIGYLSSASFSTVCDKPSRLSSLFEHSIDITRTITTTCMPLKPMAALAMAFW